MPPFRFHWLSYYAVVALFLSSGHAATAGVQDVSFARDIRPILSDNCFFCHGPDSKHRKARLRLDTKTGLHSVLEPGNSKKSELYSRIIEKDRGQMPPKRSGKSLKPEEIAVIKRWIDQGGKFEDHWSFVAPKKAPLPTVKNKNWLRNPVDSFVLAKLEANGLNPSPQADRRTLLRRVTFDLTGLPPTTKELQDFLADESPDAYEKVVDRLLASPHYGERMAMVWLDAARYSDTDGFQLDQTRTNWPWRDWVIRAYNANMPFDQFTIEQFAGDMLPDATKEQILATSFHRHHMTNGEGGRDPEESRIDYVVDRVNTTGTVWLGLTLGCCQCHDHRYDPIEQKEYYQLFAFFNSIDEDGRAGSAAKPYLKYKSPQAQKAVADARLWLQAKEAELKAATEDSQAAYQAWLEAQVRSIQQKKKHDSWAAFRAEETKTTEQTTITMDEHGHYQITGPNPRHDDYVLSGPVPFKRVTGMRLHILPQEQSGKPAGLSLAKDGHIILTNLKVSMRRTGQRQLQEVEVTSARADFENKGNGARSYGPVRGVLDDDPRTGWSTIGSKADEPRTAVFAFAKPIAVTPGDEIVIELRHRSLRGQSNIRRFKVELTDERGPLLQRVGPSPLEKLAASGGQLDTIGKNEQADLREQFLQDYQPVMQARTAVELARQRHASANQAAAGVNVMVLKERTKPRTTYLLNRGVWDNRGEQIDRSTPEALSPWPAKTSKDRLGLARWLVDRTNPLTARVAINRYWQMYFGAGLIRTPEDFGSQGEAPTHPALLDWLAVEFMEKGWDVKHIQKLIVTSATYRQSSHVSDALLKRDPENRLLARASRFRLPSWMIRDAALTYSGLLEKRLGGPPIFPYQPAGVWAESTMGRFQYQHSVGSDLYRRSVYAFWRRSVAPTGLFDAAQRRVCQIRVPRTNTPLHALNLMNDTTYVEAARVLAQQIMVTEGDSQTRISRLFERVLSREPEAQELELLTRQLKIARAYYETHPKEAARFLSHGQAPVSDNLNVTDLSALTTVTSTLLNLDEAITHE